MTKKKNSKISKCRLAIFVPLSIIIIICFCFTLITYTINIVRLTRQEKDLKEKLTALELETKNLNIEILKLKDPEYIAKYAREKYYYTRDGEYVIKLEEKDKEEKREDNKIDYTNYIIYGGCFILFIIIVFILKKRERVKNSV